VEVLKSRSVERLSHVSDPPSSFNLSLAIPGSCLLLLDVSGAISSLSWFRLNAAEPIPRSAVCLNQDGSLEPRDAAMSFLDSSWASAGSRASTNVTGVLSVDKPDSGRFLEEFESLEDGLCCHDNVPERKRAVALLSGLEALVGVGGRGLEGSLASSTVVSGRFGPFIEYIVIGDGGCDEGRSLREGSLASAEEAYRDEVGNGGFAGCGESFTGESDLARSITISVF
jgi:hypothetical protein